MMFNRKEAEGYGAERMPSRRPSLLTLAVIGALALALLVGGIALGTNLTKDETSATPAATQTVVVDDPAATVNEVQRSAAAPVSAQSMTAKEAAVAPCTNPQGGATTPLLAAPAGATWEQVDGRWVPKGQAGPTITGGSVRRCYAHTPEGAAYALYNIPFLAQRGADRELVRKYQMKPGMALDYLRENEDAIRGEGLIAQTKAVRIIDYRPDQVRYEIIESYQEKQWILGGQLVWEDGDWKWDGSVPPPPRRAPQSVEGEQGWFIWHAPAVQ